MTYYSCLLWKASWGFKNSYCVCQCFNLEGNALDISIRLCHYLVTCDMLMEGKITNANQPHFGIFERHNERWVSENTLNNKFWDLKVFMVCSHCLTPRLIQRPIKNRLYRIQLWRGVHTQIPIEFCVNVLVSVSVSVSVSGSVNTPLHTLA